MRYKTMRGQLAMVAAVATVASLAACSPVDNAKETPKSSDLTSVTIQIDGAAVPYYAPLYEAMEQGYFADEGLDVEFAYAEASSVLQNVAAGNVEFGFPNGDSVITAKANGVDVEVVHTTYQQGIGAVLFNEETNPITRPEDLRGKTVAVTDLGSPNYIQLQAMLASADMKLSDINVVTVGSGSIVAALQNGEVDAIVFSRIRYFALKSAGFPVGQMLSDKYLPSFGNVLVTSPSLREQSPDVVAGFVSALDKGIQYVIDNTDAAISEVITKYSDSFAGQEESISQVITDVFVADLWQSEATDKNGLGYGDLEKWQAAIDAQVDFGLIDEAFDASLLVVEPGDL